MPTPKQDLPDTNGTTHEDEALPEAAEDHVLDETARMAREGRKALESDPHEPKPAAD